MTRSRADDEAAATNRQLDVEEHSRHPVGDDARERLLARIPATERLLQLAGVSTAVLEGGDGPPVVLLHSSGEFAALWMRVIPNLVTTHRVVAPDLPGHGASEAAGDPLDAERVLAWLGELIEQTCPSPPALVGHGLGGAMAARLASDQCERLSRLVLVDAFGLGRFEPAPTFALALNRFLEQPTKRTRDRLFQQCFVDLDRLREETGEGWELLAAYALDRARTPGMKAALGSLMPQLGVPAIPPADLARIAVPTALIWGRHDLQVRLRIAEAASERHGWPLHVIENAGDDPAMEQPEAFLAALRPMLETLTREEAATEAAVAEANRRAGVAFDRIVPAVAVPPATEEDGVMSSVPTADPVQLLRETLSGQVLAPGDPGYDQARRLHNGLIDKHPAAIARCLHTADVVDAVNFGKSKGLEISVRGGGHNVAGKAVTDGGLMIDLSLMKGIHVDPVRFAARAQAGVILGEYNRATAAFGLATPGGVVSTTGIAGLTLGGGIAWLMGKYGMAVDNLLSAEVVLASGAVVTASEDTDPDLFWALRGGGGNFGVVTSFEYRAHPLVSVLGGPVLHALEAAPQLFSFYREFAADLPDELSTQAVFLHAPDGSGTKLCGIAVCHAGDDADRAEADVRPLRQFGSPAADMVQRMPYPDVNTGADWLFPPGALSYWKSAFFSDLSDPAVEVMTKAFEKAPSELCALAVEDFHGAVTRVSPTATAYPHRKPGYNLLLISQWTDPDQTDTCIAWARETFDALSPYMADRSYTNYLSADDYDRVRQAYGPNYERLVELKRRYDPDNLFRFNHNIDPNG